MILCVCLQFTPLPHGDQAFISLPLLPPVMIRHEAPLVGGLCSACLDLYSLAVDANKAVLERL